MAVVTSNQHAAPKTRTDIRLKLEREQLRYTLDSKLERHQRALQKRRAQDAAALEALDFAWLEENAALLARLRELDKALGK